MQEESRTGSTLLGLLAVSVVAVACATAATPSSELAAGTASIHAARSVDAARFAPRDIDSASAKLQHARDLARTGRNEQARRLAEEADVDAQVARANAAAERSRLAVLEVEASLRHEIERLNAASTHAVQ